MIITFDLPPLSLNNMYHSNRRGGFYKDQKIKDWEEKTLWELKKVKKQKKLITYFFISFYYGDKRKHDIDSNVKVILDLLCKAGFYKDDSEIEDLYLHKKYDKDNPRVEIIL